MGPHHVHHGQERARERAERKEQHAEVHAEEACSSAQAVQRAAAQRAAYDIIADLAHSMGGAPDSARERSPRHDGFTRACGNACVRYVRACFSECVHLLCAWVHGSVGYVRACSLCLACKASGGCECASVSA